MLLQTQAVFVLHCAEGRVTFLLTPHFCTLHTWKRKKYLCFSIYIIPSRGFECACVFLVEIHRFIYIKNKINKVTKFSFTNPKHEGHVRLGLCVLTRIKKNKICSHGAFLKAVGNYSACVCVRAFLVPVLVNSALEHVGVLQHNMVNIPEVQGKDICQFELML